MSTALHLDGRAVIDGRPLLYEEGRMGRIQEVELKDPKWIRQRDEGTDRYWHRVVSVDRDSMTATTACGLEIRHFNLQALSFEEEVPGDWRPCPKLLLANPEPEPEQQAPATAYAEDDHPPRYNKGLIETIDIMESVAVSWQDLPAAIPSVTTAIKYIDRAPHKGAPSRDLRKALWYLNRALEHVEEAEIVGVDFTAPEP